MIKYTRGKNPNSRNNPELFIKGHKQFNSGRTHFKKGCKSWSKGTKRILKKNSGSFEKGCTPWHKGKKIGPLSEKTKRKMSLASKGKPKPWFKGRKLTKEHIRKILHRRDKSSLEIKFEKIIKKFKLPFNFVGNGEVVIGGKCPDFVHNDIFRKLAIEVYYRKHKEMFRNGLVNWLVNRKKIFNDYGWDILFFDETQVNEENIRMVLGVFRL